MTMPRVAITSKTPKGLQSKACRHLPAQKVGTPPTSIKKLCMDMLRGHLASYHLPTTGSRQQQVEWLSHHVHSVAAKKVQRPHGGWKSKCQSYPPQLEQQKHRRPRSTPSESDTHSSGQSSPHSSGRSSPPSGGDDTRPQKRRTSQSHLPSKRRKYTHPHGTSSESGVSLPQPICITIGTAPYHTRQPPHIPQSLVSRLHPAAGTTAVGEGTAANEDDITVLVQQTLLPSQ